MIDIWKRKCQDLKVIADSWWSLLLGGDWSYDITLAHACFADCLESHKSKDELIKQLNNENTDLAMRLELAEQMMLDFSKRMIAQVQESGSQHGD